MTWADRPDQIKNYPYVRDAIDRAAFDLYYQTGFNPPTRPDGFLDDGERAAWERWREKVDEHGQLADGR